MKHMDNKQMKRYNITFILKTGDEQLVTTYGKSQQKAVQNAILSVDIDDLEHLTLKNGVFHDEFGEIQDQIDGKYEKNSVLVYVGGGIPIVIANSNIYIDEIEPTREAVSIKRGDFVEFQIATAGALLTFGGIAWRRFENQHGKGWVLLDENQPSKNSTVYDANIFAVNRTTVEYDEQTRELFRTVWNDEEETA